MTTSASPFTGIGTRSYNRVSDIDQKQQPHARPAQKVAGRVQALRDLLQEHRRLTARQLATMAELPSTAAVGGLLKNDIALERIKFDGEAYCWCGNESAEQLRIAIRTSIALLRRNGYTVEKPHG